MKSIRRRLIGLTLPSLLLLALAAGFGLYVVAKHALELQLDDSVSDEAHALGTLLVDRGDRIEFEFADEAMPEYSRAKAPEYFEIRRANGEVFERSKTLASRDAHLEIPQNAGRRLWDLRLPDGRSGRAVRTQVTPRFAPDDDDDAKLERAKSAEMFTFVLARSREDVDRLLARLLASLVGGGIALALGATWIVMRAVRIGLEPVDRLARAVANVDERSLELGVARSELPIELHVVRDRLDDSLRRLAAAFERERRFTSAAAHELRTPIAELSAIAEVAERWPIDAEHGARALREVQAIADEMEALVTHLLELARADARGAPRPTQTIDAAELVADVLEPRRRFAAERGLSIELDASLERAPSFAADPLLARAIVRNLLANAIEHAPEGGRVRIAASEIDGALALEIRNTNAGLVAADLARLVEPFWRKDEARHDRAHFGLGLSLCDALAKSIGARLSFELAQGGDLCARVAFAAPIGDSDGAARVRNPSPPPLNPTPA